MTKPSTRSLKKLLSAWTDFVSGTDFPQPPVYSGQDIQLSSIVEHTAHVEAGSCFVARVRTGTDGHPYIGEAIDRGASLIVGQRDPGELQVDLAPANYLQVEDSAVVEAWLSAAWYDFPASNLAITGVTGTDGKTTTVNILFNILKAAGVKAGMLSTLRASAGGDDEALAVHVTTPEAPVIQGYLRRMVDTGLSHCVLEVTSHGLAQERVGAITFDVAVVTNITHEHLDYHGSYENYLLTKSGLLHKLRPGTQRAWSSEIDNNKSGEGQAPASFARRPPLATAILNRDDSSFEQLAEIPVPAMISYGLNDMPVLQEAHLSATNINYGSDKTRFTMVLPDRSELPVNSKLVGPFNVYNMLAASAAAYALGISAADIRQGLEGQSQLSGRMQPVDRGQPFQVIVDFAHTPNALAQAIGAARRMSNGRLITVFGSAGKRDVEKRRLMAELSSQQADLTILTAEDPRTESLNDILQMMAEGCQKQGGREGHSFWRIPDRGQAIYFAMELASPGDLVLICGKGHETSMCFGITEYPWDDLQAATEALDAFMSGREMPDLGLPTFNSADSKTT